MLEAPYFQSEDEWLDYRLENDPRFLRRIDKARKSLRAGRGVRLEDIKRGQGLRRATVRAQPFNAE